MIPKLQATLGSLAAKMFGIGPLVAKILEKIPDSAEREKARLEFETQMAAHKTEWLRILSEADKGQLEINKVEAQSAHFYIAGARPTVLWICNVALAWMYVIQPAVQSILFWFGQAAEPGKLDSAGITGLTASLLGFGGFRMYESLKGVERSNLKEF